MPKHITETTKLKCQFGAKTTPLSVTSQTFMHIEGKLQATEEENAIYRTYEGKDYTKSEWKDFEQKQWEDYQKRRQQNNEPKKKGFWG